MIHYKSTREIELMRESCHLAAKCLDMLEGQIRPGMSTEDINTICHEFILDNKAIPAPLNYHGFPKSVCTSLNHVICHGIPSKKDIIKEGDILNVDVTTILHQFHGDTNRTYFVGEVSDKAKHLVKTTYDCMMAGIAVVKPGATLGDVGHAIQTLAESKGYSVVRDYCGHGIGREFHESPQVLHVGEPGKGLKLKEGMTFTVEPMINEGKYHTKLLKDGWTAITKDGKLSAQFEHTILVTSNGHEIMTLSAQEKDELL